MSVDGASLGWRSGGKGVSLPDMSPLALPPSADRNHQLARIIGGVGAVLLAIGATAPLASVGIGPLAKTVTFSLVSEPRVYVLVAIAAATLALAVLGRTRWFVWSAAGVLATFLSMVSLGGKSSVEMPGWVSDILSSIAKGAMNLVTFHVGTPCLALGILLILGVGAWRCRSAS